MFVNASSVEKFLRCIIYKNKAVTPFILMPQSVQSMENFLDARYKSTKVPMLGSATTRVRPFRTRTEWNPENATTRRRAELQ